MGTDYNIGEVVESSQYLLMPTKKGISISRREAETRRDNIAIIQELVTRLGTLDTATLNREKNALNVSFQAFYPVAVAALLFRDTCAELDVSPEAWSQRWAEFEEALSFAEKVNNKGDSTGIVGELRLYAKELVRDKERYTQIAASGSWELELMKEQLDLKIHLTDIQKHSRHIWENISIILDQFLMSAAFIEGVYVGRKANRDSDLTLIVDLIQNFKTGTVENLEKALERKNRQLDAAIGLKGNLNEALKHPAEVASDMFKLVEPELTPEERDLRDWLVAGKSQNAWGRQRAKQGLRGSKAYVSGIRVRIESKYTAAKLESPFLRCKGGRPPTARVQGEASGTAEDAELRGLLNGRTRKPTQRKSPDN